MRIARSCILALYLLPAAAAALAQVGGITVVVTDADGAPFPGATVTISHGTAFVKTTSALSDKQGIVRFPVLRPGPGYRIEVSFPGFSPVRYDDLRIRLNEQEAIDVQLIEALQEHVRVVVTSNVVDLDRSESATKFSAEFIGDLPVLDRFYQNVLTMAPGVQDANADGNPNVHGSRTRDFQALVGGVSNVDPLTGQWMSRINPNSIEEMEVIVSGASVEFGRSQGGFATIIQKQGSNQHEGIVEYHYQTSDLDGEGAEDESDLPAPEFETNQPGFQFSGPVVKDRLWYRVSYERRDREEPVGIAIHKHDSETRDAQLTWQVSPRNKLALKFRSDPTQEENFGVSSRTPAESSQDRGRDVATWDLTWTAPYSPRILAESTVAWQDVNLSIDPTAEGLPNRCVPNSVTGFLREAQCLNLALDQLSGAYGEHIDDHRQRFTFKTQATVYAGRLWGASHQLKLGFVVANERYFRDLERVPSITYEEEFPFGGIPFARILAEVDVPAEDLVRATGTNWALYAEDQLKPLSNLTITLGARVDREELNSEGRRPLDTQGELATFESNIPLVDAGGGISLFHPEGWAQYFTGYEAFGEFEEQLADILCGGMAPSEVAHCELIVTSEVLSQLQEELVHKRQTTGMNISNTNLSPLLALAWDPWSDGKTAIKASVRRYYNNIPLVVPLAELEPVRATVEYRADLLTFQTQIHGGISPNITVRTVDHGLKTPYQDEYTVSFERELWAETALRLTYVNRHFKDQLQDQDLNLKTGDYGFCASPFVQANFDINVVASDGKGQFVTDPWTGETYQDTADGIGDGRIDDCGGNTFFVGGTGSFGQNAVTIQSPDGLQDLYAANPFWGGIYEIGNINEAKYEAYVVELVRRLYRNWEMNGSYTYSKTRGNGEDLEQELLNDPSLRDSVYGYQSYDQRHVVKLNATAVTPWGLRLGTAVTWQSGLPYSLLTEGISEDILPPSTSIFVPPGARVRQTYPTGVRNDQRNDSYWNVDVKVTKELQLARGFDLQLSAEVFNVLADDTYQIYNPFLEAGQQLDGTNEAERRFGRRWQVGARLAF